MRALITGGAGFLGHHLANALVAQGHRVAAVDDLSAGSRGMLDPRVTFTEGDVRDIPLLWTLLRDVDVVFHLAAKVSVSESILYPVEYNGVNTGGTVSLMTACRDAGVRRVVFASSGTVYGEQPTQPIAETARPNPPNPYAVSKLAAEGYVRSIGDLYRIETVILRVFNAYGPGQRTPSNHPPVIPHFARQVRTGGSVVLHGTPPGHQTRDFVYVDDVVAAMIDAGSVAGLAGEVFNIASGAETTLLDLVDCLERVTGTDALTVASPEHAGGVAHMCADIRRADRELGWRPRVSLEDGIDRLLEHLARADPPPAGPEGPGPRADADRPRGVTLTEKTR